MFETLRLNNHCLDCIHAKPSLTLFWCEQTDQYVLGFDGDSCMDWSNKPNVLDPDTYSEYLSYLESS
jgi:hypothetical protein